MSSCGLQGGFDFEVIKERISLLSFVDKTKLNNLWGRIDKECLKHDASFDKPGGLLDFLKANYDFAMNILRLLHWTNNAGRLCIFMLVFVGTTIGGWKGFNWKK